jgi:hypothetical protein
VVEEARPHDHERPQRSLEAELLPSLAGGEAVNAIVYGRAIENYLNDAPVDVGVKLNAGNTTTPIVGEALPVLSIVAYLDHNWTKVWSTSAGYSRVQQQRAGGERVQDRSVRHRKPSVHAGAEHYDRRRVPVGPAAEPLRRLDGERLSLRVLIQIQLFIQAGRLIEHPGIRRPSRWSFRDRSW